MTQGSQATIIGAGRVGLKLAELLTASGGRVRFVDHRPVAGIDQNLIVSDAIHLTLEAESAIAESDIVVLSLPFTVAGAAFGSACRRLKGGALLIETLSVKTRPASWAANLPREVEYLGLNPLFSPELGWANRPVAVIAYRSGPRLEVFLQLLRRTNASLVALDAEAHDRLLAQRQLAAHALLLSLASILRDENTEFPLEVGPPPYHLLLAGVGRMLCGNPETFAEIQTENPFAATVRLRLIAELERLSAGGQEVLDHLRCEWRDLAPRLKPAAKTCERLFACPIFPLEMSEHDYRSGECRPARSD
ncbi:MULTISPECIES: NAD(P)-binding domain-containing protein [Bradyrhizobium]|jgi:4-amino-4-deoxyprephenate dehydrogenase|uniref:Prephenate dehydrogenase n=1 Tax=Bradyrhizobium elkanii TaxID=29448 RepID=A0ABV4EU75_BRAEL|nr:MULTISPECIES: NAD(P)-binding domain-containing protein [Bradyrhizobium]MCP1755732.1 prephenate dehydrogenase [Bradyrhizobium elkanii]MCP1929408.1 prephenate dehydrogenase [Bradyrhizobium elkanii]MCP1981247.1 prephenate dehydrogenase [Bradyrhizobium elkanii]MCS3452266.1 prephenate dehydrogenase [Bradyrhizobium elkanii]MCS3473272.1 prephenate dehydrogenase [Bradyrhizobium elkanii]